MRNQLMMNSARTGRMSAGTTWLGPRRWAPVTMAALSVATLGLSVTNTGTASAQTTYNASTDPYSMAAATTFSGASLWWTAGFTGRGVDVAVIDSGVSPVQGLSGPGKIINGPDLSLESQAPHLRNLDTFGHGTFMAGLIAGKDDALTAPYALAPASAYRGMAPDARIVSLKVATADGGTDVSQVIAAIDWVVAHKNDNGMNIRVLNLSYGTNTKQAAGIDPLSFAVEQAWKKGIVVVAAAGNPGYTGSNASMSLTSPAYNPFVIGVGGYDTNGTTVTTDDAIGTYSVSSGGDKKPDFVAVGSHMQGLRVPNSFLDATHPEGRIDTRYFRGSGTSMAAAVTSGTIALILQKYPALTPDQVKKFITTNAQPIAGADVQAQGAGEISLSRLLASAPPSSFAQTFKPSTGTGSLEAARGTDHLTANGVTLTGEKDIFGKAFNSTAMATASAAGTSWSGGIWNGSIWSGNSWSGNSWSGSSWSGNSWSGSSWSGNSWSGGTWT